MENQVIVVQGQQYEVVENYRNGWQAEAFRQRYVDILARYDYIVGDWGYGQLRLRGFYENNRPKVNFDQKIASLGEYLQEYCNFGCPYFVLKKITPDKGTNREGRNKKRNEEV
ncbi:MAG: hypothetical protein A6D91_02210 [Bacillaceae bacterium G1]|nr:MAG: hypothetical protein A6D91_02210 [Bacillaceae bacterium G1]